jgi:hypothetical protein
VPHAAQPEVSDAMPNRASGNARRNVGAGIIEVPNAATRRRPITPARLRARGPAVAARVRPNRARPVLRGSGFIFGETICGGIERADRADVDAGGLNVHVTGHVAARRSPRVVGVVDSIVRAAHDEV